MALQLHLNHHANRIKIENASVVDLAGFGFCLDSMILKVFSNLNNSMISFVQEIGRTLTVQLKHNRYHFYNKEVEAGT